MSLTGDHEMRTLFFAAALLLAICGTAAGADRAPRPLPSRIPPDNSIYMGWTGFYIGVNAGGAVANNRSDFSMAGLLPSASPAAGQEATERHGQEGHHGDQQHR